VAKKRHQRVTMRKCPMFLNKPHSLDRRKQIVRTGKQWLLQKLLRNLMLLHEPSTRMRVLMTTDLFRRKPRKTLKPDTKEWRPIQRKRSDIKIDIINSVEL
jgi:hypothetical protein